VGEIRDKETAQMPCRRLSPDTWCLSTLQHQRRGQRRDAVVTSVEAYKIAAALAA